MADTGFVPDAFGRGLIIPQLKTALVV